MMHGNTKIKLTTHLYLVLCVRIRGINTSTPQHALFGGY